MKPSSKNISATAKNSKPISRAPATTRTTRSPAAEPPAILLEGDAPSPPPASGPGRRYALGRAGVGTPAGLGDTGELPESYGTQQLLLTARDPHWLYAHWDLSREELKNYNAKSADKHLMLRVFRDAVGGEPYREFGVHPESRNWFAHVGLAGAKFIAELGYYAKGRKWVTISTSGATFTPPDSMSDDQSVWFETLPPDLQFDHLLKLVKRAVHENVPLIEAIQHMRAAGFAGLPEPKEMFSHQWTPAQERALAEVVKMDATRRVWMGSLEITELIRRQLAQEMWSMTAAQIGEQSSWSGAVSSFSSPLGGMERRRGFWFNVNAELIIYGATEPDATVTVGGRKIKLRSDGTFSYRFSLPDGVYELPAIATCAAGDDSRRAALEFSRRTEYTGEVGTHPQDPALRPPRAEHVA